MTEDQKANAVRKHASRQLRHIHGRTDFVRRLKNRPCMDCQGWFEPCQMEFDHRPGVAKILNISQMRGFTMPKLLAEIAKCDIVCANCHRLRTARRVVRVAE